MSEKTFLHRYIREPTYYDCYDKEKEPSCSTCTYHNYDGWGDDEYEVCDKGHHELELCEDYKEI